MPAGPNDLHQPASIVLVRLVQLQRQRTFGVSGIETDDGQAELVQLMPGPTRQRAALQPDARHPGRPRANDRRECLWRGDTPPLPERFTAAVNHADRGLLQRHVESNVLFHHTPPSCSNRQSEHIRPPCCWRALARHTPCHVDICRNRAARSHLFQFCDPQRAHCDGSTRRINRILPKLGALTVDVTNPRPAQPRPLVKRTLRRAGIVRAFHHCCA